MSFVVQCNYVQLQEALLDSSHLTILHQDAFRRGADIDFVSSVNGATTARVADPRVEVQDTEFGFYYAALRQTATPERKQVTARVTAYVAPFYCVNANGDLLGLIVPIDDNRTLHHFVWWSDTKEISKDPHRAELLHFTGLDEDALHKNGLHPDSWYLPGKPNRLNNFNQDREGMRAGLYSGLHIFFPEDAAMAVSAGEIRDRSKEVLAPSDVAISRLYRSLLSLPRALRQGQEPPGLHTDLRSVRGFSRELDPDTHWQSLVDSSTPQAVNISDTTSD
ncbi:hypothetical protein WT81_32430 [Burkholderia stagnalis]|nr:hypothetical protein WK21_19775 [Burkholderia cepacia]KWK42832.1 hypothetical protein WT80_23890 [Burkholderia stagnalis]KWK48191.1 hypothetical protein WT81_32430 [Burkholderia stagnalis]